MPEKDRQMTQGDPEIDESLYSFQEVSRLIVADTSAKEKTYGNNVT